jgi:sortase A
MSTVYKKANTIGRKRIGRLLGLGVTLLGFVLLLYLTYPLLSWKIFNEPAFATQGVMAPIPKTTVIDKDSIKSLLSATANTIIGVDYSKADNWYPSYEKSAPAVKTTTYFLSIPKLKIQNALVSSADTDLSRHLVQYPGTAMPPDKGSTVIFGHSTLPQLFDPTDYMTIFANAHTLKADDVIHVNVNNVEYAYKITSVTVTTPEDTSVLAQEYDDSHLVIITCTPPGTTWKRLIVKSRLEML